ncbi:galactokinase [Leekyejoonella antrihumi]|uniref:Galactokinase n=1 Tax=Leekyejoonella antrihumi TaxID=1660198 RepID=A0A563E6R1_9MICO|nr:galactokinase [Leekyejoonella antrihumi]TWP37901.1 galactokinase [Leekyejoonella antrihumi]
MTGPLQPPRAIDESDALEVFHRAYGGEPDGVWWAPGRVNIIGEHTDYNGGFVLPIALPIGTVAAVRRREDRSLRVRSANVKGRKGSRKIDLTTVHPGSDLGWAAYVAGVGWAAAERGLPVQGLDIALRSNVPSGSGLSSSAALSCVTAKAWADLQGWSLDDPTIAALGRDAENEIAGAPTGVMDQLASVCGRAGHAMQIDTRSVDVAQIPFALGTFGLSLLVIDSRAPHSLVDGEYAERRQSCEEAALRLAVKELRDVPVEALDTTLTKLPELLARRARHVITDSHRVELVAEMLRSGDDPRRIGTLLNDSHTSMRDDFEITVPAVDTIQEAAIAAGAHGARMTGGGFGGCVIALVEQDAAGPIATACAAAATRAGHAEPVAFTAKPADGARRLSL